MKELKAIPATKFSNL